MTNDRVDEARRAASRAPSAVVGIGASAGGIEALRTFFANVPPSGGIAYVVILHLSPDYESRLAEVLQVTAPFPVVQVRESMRLEGDRVYVISPNQILEVSDGSLVVTMMPRGDERRAPVDMFFRALATAYRSSAIAIVLSGTGPNGSNGLKRVKELGGLTIAQDPEEAEYKDMPANSIKTGLIDHVMPVALMPGRVADYMRRQASTSVTLSMAADEAFDTAGDELTFNQIRLAQDWRDVLALLRVRTGQDFANYKAATIRRRVERRLNVRGMSTLAEYADLMRSDPAEPLLLMKELLISVTNFFRDPEAFAAVEQRVILQLFERKGATDQVRIWSAGCATGEEAYSLAMLLAEHSGGMLAGPTLQVFATDLDEQAIAVAREGLYSDADVADVSPERLVRFFQREAGGYRVRRELRELVLFAHHNVIKDPPFSHLDLISCRNLLIYLNRTVQERLIETFHFALRPGGILFVGTSEVADTAADLFMVFDKNAHIFESGMVTSRPTLPLVMDRTLPLTPSIARPPEPRPQQERISPGELHLRLLEQFAPPSLVVNEEHTLLHVSQRAGEFLQMTGGEPSREVLKLIQPDLRADLRTALHLAAQERSPVEVRAARLALPGGERSIRITVKPVLREDGPPRGYFLVLFDDEPADGAAPPPAVGARHLTSPVDAEARQLSEELARVKGQLRLTVEQYEIHAEEARAANEELQAMNEELRSAAEELETSKEELQSVNEELTTVNQELKIKIEELGLTNNDFKNLINATDIGAIFLDRSLRVKLSTPGAQDIFNLLPTDIGRRLSDITSRIKYEPLHDDMVHVLERLQTIEREVETREGKWYLMRVLPYRTTDDRIDGVALTFHDITKRREAELQVRAGEERLRLLIDSVVDYAVFTTTEDGIIDGWNPGAERMFGYPAEAIIGQRLAVLFTREDQQAHVPEREMETARVQGRATDERWHLRGDGSRFYCSGVTTRIAGGNGFATVARDLTERRQAEVDLQAGRNELEERVDQRTRELQDELTRGAVGRAQITGLLRRIVTAQEDERARIARDLHDQLGQQMTALRLVLEQHVERCDATEDVAKALQLARGIDEEVDFLAWELRPAALDDLGLAAALPRYLKEWSDHFAIRGNFQGNGSLAGLLPPAAETAFYRVAQEALNNVSKHAQASRVDVILERRDGLVELVIEDDGVGFEVSNRVITERGIGLAGMRQRAALVNATLLVESTPGKGTTVFLRRQIEQPEGGTAV